jgi:protein-tyrosine phosphatase
MNQISPYQIWVGHTVDEGDFRVIFDTGIQALMQVAIEEMTPLVPRELIYCKFPLVDGTGNRAEVLQLAIKTLAALITQHIPTLVACGAGISRSPAIVAAALALAHREPPEQWLQRVVQHHPSDVSPAFWSEVVGVLNSLAP